MQNTPDVAGLGEALIDLIGFLNSPQRDGALLRAAGVVLDRALFPLLVALGRRGPLSVADIADLVGRDHTTISRQLAKLESLALIDRREDVHDRRRRSAELTKDGAAIVRRIARARGRLLSQALADWSEEDRAFLAGQFRRFADSLAAFARTLA